MVRKWKGTQVKSQIDHHSANAQVHQWNTNLSKFFTIHSFIKPSYGNMRCSREILYVLCSPLPHLLLLTATALSVWLVPSKNRIPVSPKRYLKREMQITPQFNGRRILLSFFANFKIRENWILFTAYRIFDKFFFVCYLEVSDGWMVESFSQILSKTTKTTFCTTAAMVAFLSQTKGLLTPFKFF